MMALLILGPDLMVGCPIISVASCRTQRAAMGKRAKAIIAVAIVVALVLTSSEYRGARVIPVWTPPPFLTQSLTTCLMVLAFWVYGSKRRQRPKDGPRRKAATRS